MAKKLFVGSLSWNTDERALREAFSPFGTITEAAVISDRDSGRSRGFGFLTFEDDDAADKAIAALTTPSSTAAPSGWTLPRRSAATAGNHLSDTLEPLPRGGVFSWASQPRRRHRGQVPCDLLAWSLSQPTRGGSRGAHTRPTGTFTYTISDGMGGTGTASVTINVECVNDAPLAQNDAYSTNQNTKLIVAAPGVLVNDSDPVEGSPISVSCYDAAGTFGGTIVMNPDGSFTYTPAKDFAGYDTFTYTISDGQGGYATATVTSTVAAKNGRSIAVSWGDWSKSGNQLNGYFNVQNMSSGGYAVQLTSFAVQVQYKTSGGNIWTDVAANNCVYNPAAPTLLQNIKTIQFSGCQLGSSIPSGTL